MDFKSFFYSYFYLIIHQAVRSFGSDERNPRRVFSSFLRGFRRNPVTIRAALEKLEPIDRIGILRKSRRPFSRPSINHQPRCIPPSVIKYHRSIKRGRDGSPIHPCVYPTSNAGSPDKPAITSSNPPRRSILKLGDGQSRTLEKRLESRLSLV